MKRQVRIAFIVFLCCFLAESLSLSAESVREQVPPWITFWGRFHPVIVHLPIGFLLAGALAAFAGQTKKLRSLEGSAGAFLLVGALFAFIAVLSGYLLSLSADYDTDLLNIHFWFGLSVAVLSAGTYICYRLSNRISRPPWRLLSRITAVLMVIAVMAAGHYGGSLTHGEGYLTENLNESVKKMIGMRVVPPVEPQPITDPEEAVLYRDVIFPLLREKCLSCHNAGKKRGRLILDGPDGLLAGGISGNTLIPGDPENSELYKRIILPEGDKKRMPPEGRAELTERSVSLIYAWIKDSASFTKKIAATRLDQKTKDILIRSLSADGSVGIFVKKIPPGDSLSIASLHASGVKIQPVADHQRFLELNFINLPAITDKEAGSIKNLALQITWLKASNLSLSQQAVESIGTLKNLTVLQLDNTDLTDESLKYFQHLENLESLNLYNTRVSDKGIKYLSGLKKLKKIFLSQTGVDSAGVNLLRQAIPTLKIL